MTDSNFWIQKLAAFLHDPPSKAFGIAGHEDARGPLLRHLGITEEEMKAWNRESDWWASAADRYPFPDAQKLYVDWKLDGRLQFHHPLAGTRFTPSDQPRGNSAVGEAWLESALHGLNFENADERAKYFRLWRFWAERATREKHDLMAYLVADTRLPDHTLWQHNAVASALTATNSQPAFLLFQIGPVQDFIAQSRKMQDLWSGSYLLSFIISKAIAAVALKLGPDAIIYPSLKGSPLLDWWWSQEKGLFPEGTFQMGKGRLHPDELLIPSLPNRFLALVPANQAEEIQGIAAKAVKDVWMKICDAVHADICDKLQDVLAADQFTDWDKDWQKQVSRFPVTDSQIHVWTDSKTAIEWAKEKNTPPIAGGWETHPLNYAEHWRQIVGNSKHSSLTQGSAWALHYALVDWKFAATKNARSFEAWKSKTPSEKDNLNGRDEILGGENAADFWKALRAAYRGERSGDFKGSQRYGALSVIKRLWAKTYLKQLGWNAFAPPFESVQDIARAIDSDEDEIATGPEYYAVLCMDGDDMGQWLSGTRTLPMETALSNKAAAYFRQHWKHPTVKSSEVRRVLSPSYHAALSEALNHFSLYAAGPIVEHFKGQLFYAGGDDVLAILPASEAVSCAEALKCAFQGFISEETSPRIKESLNSLFDFPTKEGGFLTCKTHAGTHEKLRPNWPLIVMGPTASVSVGIAVGHTRSPMQEVIQAAREAESGAKKVPNKGAICLRVMKRSGESAEFAASFTSGVPALWQELDAADLEASGRFVYRYLELLKPLFARSDKHSDQGWEPKWTQELLDFSEAELRHVLKNQANLDSETAASYAHRWIHLLVGDLSKPSLSPRAFLHFWMAWSFMKRLTA